MSKNYTPTAQSPHGYEEERQWARIAAAGEPHLGVALVFIQKLCTAFHEVEPAWRHGALNPVALDYFRERLLNRARRLLQVLEANDLGAIRGVNELRSLVETFQEVKSLQALAMLADPVHHLSHVLSDALEAEAVGASSTSTMPPSTTTSTGNRRTPPREPEAVETDGGGADGAEAPGFDNVYRYNQKRWEALAQAGALFTRPWLDLDEDKARERLDPQGLLSEWVGDVAGKDVLCLAGGGGQQSAAFGLLGARVTILDIAEGQLARDQEAADYYGYDVATLQGDMRDLSALDAAAFDVVWHPYSLNFVPDCEVVFCEVARILRPCGLYHVGVANPFACGMGTGDWNGEGYVLRRPYIQGEEITYPDEDWVFRSSSQVRPNISPPREYRQTLGHLLNSLVGHGFSLSRLVTWADHEQKLGAEPGSWGHFVSYLPPWFQIWARFRPDPDTVCGKPTSHTLE